MESNTFDQMQNTSFVYHPESLIEMQIICLVVILYYVHREELDQTHPKDLVMDSRSSDFIMGSLLIEHLFSYCVAFYRAFDISRNGEIDTNGVKRAKTEQLLAKIQFFITCMIIGYSVNHYL